MKVLFLCRRYPFPLDRGDNRRSFHLLEGVSRVADARLLCFGSGPALPVPEVPVVSIGDRVGARRALGPDAGGVLLGNLAALRPRLPLQVRASLDRRFTLALRRELEDERPDVVHASPSTMATYLNEVPSAVHKHLDLMDALSIIMEGQARSADPPLRRVFEQEARLLRDFEAEAVRRADTSSLASATDKARAPGLESAAVIPQGVDEREFPFVPPSDRPPVLLFFGNLSWPPNAEAAGHLARVVFPLVRRSIPDARLRIVGAAGSPQLRELEATPGVEVVGAVPQVAPELHGAACALLPIYSGAGVKTKVLEAFSSGTPVVTNRFGVEGIVDVQPGRQALLAEDPVDLAAGCVRLISNPAERQRLAHEALELVRRVYSWEAHTKILLDLYSSRRT